MSKSFNSFLMVIIFTTLSNAKYKDDLLNGNGFIVNFGISKIDLKYENPPTYWNNALRCGFSIGVNWEYCFSKHFSVNLGLEFTELGDKKKYDYLSPLWEFDSSASQWELIDTIRIVGSTQKSLTYVAFPLHLNFRIKSISSKIFVGCSYGYALSSNQRWDEYIDEKESGTGMRMEKLINRNNVSVQIGSYYEPAKFNGRLLIGIMYSEGLSKISDDPYWYSDFRSNEIRLFIGTKIKS
jgi:hypothetical protein